MPSHCPPDELLTQLLVERLTPTSEDELESHLQACDSCRHRLERLAVESETSSLRAVRAWPPLAPDFAQRLEDSLRDSQDGGELDTDLAPPEIPGYELLELIGRGGSCLVFRARDEKLQRTVAVKVLRERANRVDRERFNREAMALAALRHPNITRAHGAGECNERPFLVLEYVAGGNLGRYISGRPQPPREAARLIRQLAGAMQVAHDAGFIHRDLKPANVLLDAHPGPGKIAGLDRFVPKVTDLGIVKDLSRDDGFTQTRDCLGTPSYMAPEQVKGSNQPVDYRTDVYALGAILYESITGRPPFRAGSPLDTMLQVKQDEPVTPSRFHPKLPSDLETICLKCLEKDPARRYQSARLLADDLGRYLDGQPIMARRTHWLSRAWRWCRRNPGWTAAALASLTILLTLAVGGPLVAHRERALREQALLHERQAHAERTHAREQFELASQALEGTLGQVLRSARLQDTAFDEIRTCLIRGAAPYYDQFVQGESSDQSVRLRQARMLMQLASVHAKERQTDKARTAHRRSIELLESLSAEATPTDQSVRSSLATAHLEFGRFLQLTDNDTAAAEQHYRSAITLRMQLLDQNPKDASLRDHAAIALSLLGTLEMPRPDLANEARHYLAKAIAIRDSLVADFPERSDLRHYAAMSHLNMGLLQRQLNDNPKEIQEFQTGWEQERVANASAAAGSDTPYFLSTLEGELGVAFFRGGQRDRAIQHLKSALRTAEALELAYPAATKHAELRQQWQEILASVQAR